MAPRRGSNSLSHDGRSNRHDRHEECPNCKGIMRPGCCSRSINHHWKVMPQRVKDFIICQGHLTNDGFISVEKLVEFWSKPQNVALTQRVDVTGASWYLALLYSRLGLMKEARALTINGAFIHQCIISSIEYIKDLCSSGASKEEIMLGLPCCTEGFYATKSPEEMESFIQRYLPPDYQHTLTTFANLSSRDDVMGYVDQISEDYKSTKQNKLYHDNNEGVQMKLIFINVHTGDQHVIDTLSSTALKTTFTAYANDRGVSLRSLRFSSHKGPIFLSQISKKTLKEVPLNQDVILVHDVEQDTKNSNVPSKRTPNKAKKTSRTISSKTKKGTKQRVEPVKIEKTQEELKIEHSKLLSKVHEELQPRLKNIRQRLNNLLIERSQPKKRHHSKSVSITTLTLTDTPCPQCIGGKAGKSHFDIYVGEAQNLYKSRKTSSRHHSQNICKVPTLDLHGYTRDDALIGLDQSLKKWYDVAMKGSYPFVIKARIVCGCGDQILSEVVQEWIKANKNVSNAPSKK